MSNIQPYTPQSIIPTMPTAGGRLARATSRQLVAIDQSAAIRAAEIEAEADVAMEKIGAVAKIGGCAQQRVALLATMQAQLAMAAPAASGNLDFINTVTLACIGEAIADGARQVNRR